jgi:hypothetical protein
MLGVNVLKITVAIAIIMAQCGCRNRDAIVHVDFTDREKISELEKEYKISVNKEELRINAIRIFSPLNGAAGAVLILAKNKIPEGLTFYIMQNSNYACFEVPWDGEHMTKAVIISGLREDDVIYYKLFGYGSVRFKTDWKVINIFDENIVLP